jgi:hypothetical protein
MICYINIQTHYRHFEANCKEGRRNLSGLRYLTSNKLYPNSFNCEMKVSAGGA